MADKKHAVASHGAAAYRTTKLLFNMLLARATQRSRMLRVGEL